MPKHKSILLIIILVLLTYANSLFNGFVGDDSFLFGPNRFYKEAVNLSRLFSKDFVMSRQDLTSTVMSGPPSLSGCVAYRPITAFSFFVDNFLWKDRPAGFHLSNIVLHIFTALGLFALLNLILHDARLALFSVLLFALHPIQAEAVNNIGYRSDILATLFFITALWALIKATTEKYSARLMGAGLAAFFLALFSKETAVMLPLVLAAYHVIVSRPKQARNQCAAIYAGLTLILLFYLYLYIFVFSNASLAANEKLFDWQNFSVAFKALAGYLSALVFAQQVVILPSFHPLSTKFFLIDWAALGALLAVIIGLLRYARKDERGKRLLFFAGWFMLTFLPASNIMALPSPFAYRFMYLPSIGFFVILASGLQRLFDEITRRSKKNLIENLLKSGILVIYMSLCFPLNSFYHDDLHFFRKQVEYFPEAAYANLILASTYQRAGQYDKAIEHYQKYYTKIPVQNDFDRYRPDYEILAQIGSCYIDQPDKAIEYFKKSIAKEPHYAIAYANLGKAYMLKGDYDEALTFIKASLALDDKLLAGYFYGIEALARSGQREQALQLLEKALATFPGNKNLLDMKVQLGVESGDGS